ncbi:hypothetical protein BIY23_03670 [Wolbachia pipientis]|uniref:Uncharacterized protein n=1 Tax=Wolbachia pipientis TaxID=955 RepID=A0A1E7QJE3_WOLPI|nr:hypothetical protein BIY23_03670 [Wolbachia pipientis]
MYKRKPFGDQELIQGENFATKKKEMIGAIVETAFFCCAANKMGCGTLLWTIVEKLRETAQH